MYENNEPLTQFLFVSGEEGFGLMLLRIATQSDLVYPDYFVLSDNVSLARYPDNRNRKYRERNSFQSKCQ